MKLLTFKKNKSIMAAAFTLALLSSKAHCALDFSSFGSAPQVLAVSSVITSENLVSLTAAEPANMTLSNTNSTAYAAIFSLSYSTASSQLTIDGANANLIYFSGMTKSDLGNVTDTTMTASVALKAVDQLSPAVIANSTVAQLAAILSSGLKNPNSYRALPASLTTVGSGVLTLLTDSALIAHIPKAIRTAIMSATYSTTLTNAGWLD